MRCTNRCILRRTRQEIILTEHDPPANRKETLRKSIGRGLMRGESPLIRDQEPQNSELAVETREMEHWAETISQCDRQPILVMLSTVTPITGQWSLIIHETFFSSKVPPRPRGVTAPGAWRSDLYLHLPGDPSHLLHALWNQ